MFHGFDFDATLLRIASMNLMLHAVENSDIHNQDTLSNSFHEKFPKQAENSFDVILANPPFKGSLDEGDVHPSLTQKVKTKKTELLFVTLIPRMLKKGGRSATIVPDGVLFGSSKAHQSLRRILVEENQLITPRSHRRRGQASRSTPHRALPRPRGSRKARSRSFAKCVGGGLRGETTGDLVVRRPRRPGPENRQIRTAKGGRTGR